MEKKKRIDLIDYLKAISCLLVIATHYDWPDKHGFVFTGFINMAVPIFMILTGYNFAMSYKKKTDGSYKEMYSWKMVGPKLNRFLVPYAFIVIVEIILKLSKGMELDYWTFAKGGYGPGSYYVPLLVELLFLLPIIYKLVETHPIVGVVSVGIANLAYEYEIVLLGVEKPVYRLLVGRYLLLVALGCYLYLYGYKSVKAWAIVAMLAVGMFHQIGILGMKLDVGLFYYWRPTTMLISFYIFPIVVILFKLFYTRQIPGPFGSFLSLMGKASYHIFLAQMVYYHFHLGGHKIMDGPWYYAVPYNIVISVIAGIIFYFVEEKIRKLFRR